MIRRLRRLVGGLWLARPASDALGDLRRAIELLRRVEGESRILRADNAPLHGYVADGPLATAADLDRTTVDRRLPQAHADVVRVGKVEDSVRARGFYPSLGLTAIVHGSLPLPWPWPAALHRGAAVAERAISAGGFVIPRQIERGRGLRHAWLVEELIDGAPATADEWPALVPRVFDGLARLWHATGVEHRPVKQVLTPKLAATAHRLLESHQQLDVDRGVLRAALERLAADQRSLLVGWCHGDPMRTNVLLTPTGGLALIDWEAASRRPLAWDCTKLMLWLADPRPLAETMASTLGPLAGPQALPWRDQLVVVCLLRFARSHLRLVRARLSGSRQFEEHVDDTRQRNLGLAGRLLADES